MSSVLDNIIKNQLTKETNEENKLIDDLKAIHLRESELKIRQLSKKKLEIGDYDKAKIDALNSGLEKAIDETKKQSKKIENIDKGRKLKMDNFEYVCFRNICKHFYNQMTKQQLNELVSSKINQQEKDTDAPSNKKRVMKILHFINYNKFLI